MEKYKLKDILYDRRIYATKEDIYPHVTLSKDGIYNKNERYNRDFLVKKEDKKYKITKKNDICYNPANLKFGVICLNEYGTAIFSPIYITFELKENMKEKINIKYLSYILTNSNFIKKVRKYEQGTVYERMAVSPNDFLNMEVELPEKEIQDKIVSYINKVDMIINKVNINLTNLYLLREKTKNRIFSNIENQCNKVKISEIFERITEKNTGLKSNNILTISAQDGLINQEEFFNKIVAGNNLEGYFYIKKGDFAYNKSYSKGYPVGATKILKKYEDGIVSTLYICFRNKKNDINIGYFEYLFESKNYYKELERITQEGNRNHGLLNMNINDFFAINISVPNKDIQSKIYNVMNKIDRKLELEIKKKDNYEMLRKGLLQKLLTGKVKVKI